MGAVGDVIDTAINALSDPDKGSTAKCWEALGDTALDGQVFGFTAQDDQACSSNTSTSGSYVDAAGFPTWTVSVPVARQYKLHVDLSLYAQSSALAAQFQLLVDGSAPGAQPANAQTFQVDQVLTGTRGHFVVLLSLAAGSHTLKLQWRRVAGTGTMSVGSLNFRCFTLLG